MTECRDWNQPLESLLGSIGCTPLLKLGRSVPAGSASIVAKIEFFNPGMSVKDRIAFGMIETAEQEGHLRPGCTVVEATTGNTAIGLAIVCSIKKYRLILVMPENYSPEYHKLLAAYGAELVLVPAEEGMTGAVAKAGEISEKTKDSFSPKQFQNRVNPGVHRTTTAKEILEELPCASIDAFVAGMGSGGTITGVAEALKAANPRILRKAFWEPERPRRIVGSLLMY